MKPLSAVTDPISGLTVDTVTSDDEQTVLTVQRQLLDLAESFDEGESTDEEWGLLADAVTRSRDLTNRISSVRDEMDIICFRGCR